MFVALLGVVALAVPAQGYRLGGARLVRAAERVLADHAAGEADTRALHQALRELPDAVALASNEGERRYVRSLEGRLADATWLAATASGEGAVALEALEAWVRRSPNHPETASRIGTTLEAADPHDAARALERLFLDRSLPQSARDRAAEALAPLRWRLSDGSPGRDLGALAWLLDQWLPHYVGPDRARMLALGGDVALRRRDYETARRRYLQADALRGLTAAQRRQLVVLETMREHRRAGTLVEASPDARFTVEVGARVSHRQAEAIREHFERAYTDWAARFGFAPRENLLVRVLVEDDLDRVLSPHIEGITEGSGILLRIRPGETAADLAVVSRHEYVHFALERMVGRGRLPRWLHEGIATWFEEHPLSASLYRRLLEARQAGSFPSEGALRTFRAGAPAAFRLLYDAAALLVERRVHEAGDGAVQRLLDGIAEGQEASALWRRETGRTLQESLDELVADLVELVRARIREARGEAPPPPTPDPEPRLILRGEGGAVLLDEEPSPRLELTPGPERPTLLPPAPPRRDGRAPRPRRDSQGRLRGPP
jgi:hypothetical protein